MGTDDFTIEAFFYNQENAVQSMITKYGNSSSDRSFWLGTLSSNNPSFYWYNGSNSYNIDGAAGTLPLDKWSHVVAQRTSGDIYLFVDGNVVASNTGSNAALSLNDTSEPVVIGSDSYASNEQPFQGFISNVRIVKGTGVYSTLGFTPPTRELTNVTNTKLLCCQSNVTSAAAAASPNISGINDGTPWSSIVTGPTRVEDRVANAFNGSTSGPGAIPAYPGTLTFAPGLTSISSVKIYGYYAGSGVTLHVNGSAQSPSAGAFTLTISTSTLDSVVWTATNGFNYMRIDAIEVDSTVLIDPVVGPDDSNEAATTFNPFITDIHAVRGQETGYATLNPLANYGLTLANGNLDWQGGTNQRYCRPTLFADSGKWYCEFHMRSTSHIPGIIREDHKDAAGILGELASSRFQNNGTIGYSGGDSVTGGTTWAAGDCVQLFMDMDNKAIYWGVNGIMKIGDDGNSGNPLSGSNHIGAVIYPGVDSLTDRISEKAWGPAVGTPSANDTGVYSSVNFGQKPFKYAPPEGYQPWNTANLRPVKVIARPDQFVGIATYVGNSTGQPITMGFKPDLLWIKSRTNSGAPAWMDSVRGSNKQLNTNNQNEESTNSATAGVLSFDSNGFTLGTESSATGSTNGSQSYVAWGWKAGGNKNTFNVDGVGYASAAAAGITNGTAPLTGCSVGTKQGFSIIAYNATGSNLTAAHGLSKRPGFIILKSKNASGVWLVWHQSLAGVDYFLKLDETIAQTQASNVFLSVDSNTFGTGNDSGINSDGQQKIAYIWHDVPGLQKFGKYFGNSDADGPYIELGFRPALLIVKRIEDSGNQWVIFDSERTKINQSSNNSAYLRSPDAGSEGTANNVDFLSNGFKWRKSDSYTNDSGSSTGFIYAAWAEAPSIDLYGGGANAR